MNYLSIQFILSMLTAIWLVYFQSILTTRSAVNTVWFKVLPVGLAFALVLTAFKVI